MVSAVASSSPAAPESATARQLIWWTFVAIAQYITGTLQRASRIPLDGVTFHYDPRAFAKWLNGVTWGSEWPKFKVTDRLVSRCPALPGRVPAGFDRSREVWCGSHLLRFQQSS